MYRIIKSSAPPELQKAKKLIPEKMLHDSRHNIWNELEAEVNTKIKTGLLTEQKFVCCYCTSEISHKTTKVEHWLPQSEYPEKRLDWENLFAACYGGEKDGNELHCDSAKGKEIITLDPRKNEHILKITYTPSGKIGSKDPLLDNDLTQTLCLNATRLQRAREAVWSAFLKHESVKKEKLRGNKRYSERLLRKAEIFHNGKQAKPHQAIVLYLLRKKMGL